MSSHCVCKRGREGELAHVPNRVWVLALLLCGSCWPQTQDPPFFLPKTKIPRASPSPVHLLPASTWTPDICVTCLTMTSTGRDRKRCKMLQEVCGVSKPKIMFFFPQAEIKPMVIWGPGKTSLHLPRCAVKKCLPTFKSQLLRRNEALGDWVPSLTPIFATYSSSPRA